MIKRPHESLTPLIFQCKENLDLMYMSSEQFRTSAVRWSSVVRVCIFEGMYVLTFAVLG